MNNQINVKGNYIHNFLGKKQIVAESGKLVKAIG